MRDDRTSRLLLVTAAALVVSLGGARAASAAAKKSGKVKLDAMTAVERGALLKKAQVWSPTDIPSQNLLDGPKGKGSFDNDQLVACDYVREKQLGGHTPKFQCRLPPDDVFKVKYGKDNGEVYASVAATRLLRALGFGADRYYPVHVVCRFCPVEPFLAPADRKVDQADYPEAAIERPLHGRTIAAKGGKGWSWKELSQVDEAAGGSPLAQREGLTLLAAVLQHGDNKPEQQRFVCLADADGAATAPDALCAHPFLYVHDVGGTFGGAGNLSRGSIISFNLNEWSKRPVWRDKAACVAQLDGALNGTLQHPTIHEAGRAFLAGLLSQLSDRQLTELFTGAGVERREQKLENAGRKVTVADWVEAFKSKRAQIVDHRCPE